MEHPDLVSIQDLHEPAAAGGEDLAGLDVDGLVAGDAVDIGVVGGPDLGDLLLLLLGKARDVEGGAALLEGSISYLL